MNDYYSGISKHHPIHDRRQKLTPCCLVETPTPSSARVILCNKGYKCLSASLFVCFYLSSWRNWINVQWISRSLCRRCICCCFIVWVWVWMSVTEPKKTTQTWMNFTAATVITQYMAKMDPIVSFFCSLVGWLLLLHVVNCFNLRIYFTNLMLLLCLLLFYVSMRECVPNLRSKH